MSTQHWDRVWSIFDAAVERPDAERDAFLDAACAGDAELRAAVARYLAADAAPALLDASPAALAEGVAPEETPPPGHAVGPYRLLRELGRGGMGVVWLAERADVEKRVALKLVRGGLAAPESVTRFLVERRALARLEHPNIARLLDAGLTDDGLPFYAMEYVEGEPLDRHCDARRLGVRERLALVQAVCRAVEHAHRSLVVHRDLKPANILVTGDGTVKLLDFGIAKLLEGDADEALTGTGVRLMTPQYAAPEQLRGEPVTTATDVYALGIVLFELLAGARPYRLTGRSLGEIERVVLETDVPRPSTLAPAPQRRALAGDLDTIVLRAMEKDPARRYASVAQLDEDVGRHLAGLPVAARPASLGYRARKFVRRHRWGVGVAAAALLAASGVGAAMVVQARRVARERDTAQQVSEFLQGLFAAASPYVSRGQALTARQLLDLGAARIRRELATQPALRARMLTAIGEAYSQLGLGDEATPLLAEALAILRREHGGDHPEIATVLDLQAAVAQEQGRRAIAERLYRDALAMRRRLHGDADPSVALSLSQVAFVLRASDREFAESERLYREALAITRTLAPAPLRLRADIHTGLGTVLERQGKLAEAEPHLRAALAVSRELAGDGDLPAVAISLNNLALLLSDMGRREESETLYTEALAMSRRLFGEDHLVTLNYATNLAVTQMRLGKMREAEALYRDGLARRRRLFAPDHPETARAMTGLASVLVATKRAREAEPLLREALAIQERQPAQVGFWLGATRSALGASLTAQHRYAEAEPVLEAAHANLRRILGARARMTQVARERLATLYTAWGKPAQAARWRSAPAAR